MRQLYVLRGIPGSGKSSFVASSGLSAHAVAPDDIRLLMGSPVLNEAGTVIMPMEDNAAVWRLLYEVIETRMARGELLVIDATHTLPTYFHDYAKLARRFRYTAFAVDFSDTPLKVCKQRNRQRAPYKAVPDPVLEKMYKRLQKTPIPRQFKVLRPEAVEDTLVNNIADLSTYKRIHHIGDIQGCYTPLKKYFDTYGLRDDEFYIFTGDLLDRGNQNTEVLQYTIGTLAGRPNVVFVEGNHDQHIWDWATRQPVRSREFLDNTKGQLESADIDIQQVEQLLKAMRPYFAYTHDAVRVLVSHGGVSTFPDRLKLLSARQYIRGVGAYDNVGTVDDAFVATTPSGTYQIHGHRNRQNYPIKYNERCFNLEGKVEFGGELRAVQLQKNRFEPVTISTATSH